MFPVTSICPFTGAGASELEARLLQGIWQTRPYFRNRTVRPYVRWGLHARRGIRPEDPFIDPSELEVVVIFDTLERDGTDRRQFFDLYPHVKSFGLALDSMNRLTTARRCHLDASLEQLPCNRFQPSQRQTVANSSLRNWFDEGTFRVRRTGDCIDLCVGSLPNKEPAVLYRINVEWFHGRNPKVTLTAPELVTANGHVILECGEISEGGWVPYGEELAHVHGKVYIQQCGLNGKQPILMEPRLPDLSLSHPLVPLMAELNRDLLDPKYPEIAAVPVVPKLMFGFSRQVLLSLPAKPEFNATSGPLLDRLLDVLASRSLALTSRGIATVAGIETSNEVTTISFENGPPQIVPSLATLKVSVGSTVIRGQTIAELGTFPREELTWGAIVKLFGRTLPEVVADFLLSEAGSLPGHVGGYYIPALHAMGVEKYALRTEQGTPACCLDLRDLLQFYHAESRSIVLPPVVRPPQPLIEWGDLVLDLGIMPHWGRTRPPIARSARSKKSGDSKPVS